MGCVPAPACKTLLTQATDLWPNRNRASDGICGDARHQARASDHNQGNAVDLTHDPANGVDAHAIAELIKQSGDRRVKYLISDRRIYNPDISPNWRTYTGSNPHTKHIHVSIDASKRNDVSPWPLTITPPQEEPDMTDEQANQLKQLVAQVGRIHHEMADPTSPLQKKLRQLQLDLDAVQKELAAHRDAG